MICQHFSDMSYGSRYTLDDVVQSMKKTGVGLKGRSYEDVHHVSCRKVASIIAMR